MLSDSPAFAGFSVDDIDAARRFYGETLGLSVEEEHGLLMLRLAGGATVIAYPKDDHVPATFTVLNFPVDDIGATARALRAAGVALLAYPQFGEPDEDGIYRDLGGGPSIGWFADPAGNVLAILTASP